MHSDTSIAATGRTAAEPEQEKVASSSSSTSLSIPVLAVTVAIAFFLILFVGLVVVYCRLRHGKASAVPPSDFNNQAHDNPVYMTASEVRGMGIGALLGRTASAGAAPRLAQRMAMPPFEEKPPLPPIPDEDEKLSNLSHSTEGANGRTQSEYDAASLSTEYDTASLSTTKSVAIDSKNVRVSFAPGVQSFQ